MKNEKRLIDANALNAKLSKMAREPYYQHDGEDYYVGIADASGAVYEAPTVDAVEVVRCKDCQHRGDDVHCPMCFEEQIEWDDDGYTEVDYVLHDRTIDDGFCDQGERREGE